MSDHYIDQSDGDLRHLLQLLALLPTPDDDDFWRTFATAESPDDPGAKDYILGKLSACIRDVVGDKVTRMDVSELALYTLMFFSKSSPELHSLLGRVTSGFDVDGQDTVGQRWCQDVTATAWGLWVGLGQSESDIQNALAAWVAHSE